jgi:hypothetical protein
MIYSAKNIKLATMADIGRILRRTRDAAHVRVMDDAAIADRHLRKLAQAELVRRRALKEKGS